MAVLAGPIQTFQVELTVSMPVDVGVGLAMAVSPALALVTVILEVAQLEVAIVPKLIVPVTERYAVIGVPLAAPEEIESDPVIVLDPAPNVPVVVTFPGKVTN